MIKDQKIRINKSIKFSTPNVERFDDKRSKTFIKDISYLKIKKYIKMTSR